jgi:hypothetical protein
MREKESDGSVKENDVAVMRWQFRMIQKITFRQSSSRAKLIIRSCFYVKGSSPRSTVKSLTLGLG